MELGSTTIALCSSIFIVSIYSGSALLKPEHWLYHWRFNMLAHKNAMDALICSPADMVARGVVRNSCGTKHRDGIQLLGLHSWRHASVCGREHAVARLTAATRQAARTDMYAGQHGEHSITKRYSKSHMEFGSSTTALFSTIFNVYIVVLLNETQCIGCVIGTPPCLLKRTQWTRRYVPLQTCWLQGGRCVTDGTK
jgi:hypothetical protein